MLRQRSSGSVSIISIDRARLLRRLRAIAERIRSEHPEVAEVRVFGSIARGDHVGTSDVDVLIVLREGELGDPIERIRSFYPYFELPMGVDLLALTRDQLRRRLEMGDAFAERMGQESKAL
jgi:predicted nucleotidyltransferase